MRFDHQRTGYRVRLAFLFLLCCWSHLSDGSSNNKNIPSCETNLVNIAFVIDTSRSIIPQDFNYTLAFTSNMLSSLQQHATPNLRFAVMTYSKEAHIELPYTSISNFTPGELLSIQHKEGIGSNIGAALSSVRQQLNLRSKGFQQVEASVGRTIVTIVTDGRSLLGNIEQEANSLPDAWGLHVLAVGSEIDAVNIQKMYKEGSGYIEHVNDFEQLSDPAFAKQYLEVICTGASALKMTTSIPWTTHALDTSREKGNQFHYWYLLALLPLLLLLCCCFYQPKRKSARFSISSKGSIASTKEPMIGNDSYIVALPQISETPVDENGINDDPTDVVYDDEEEGIDQRQQEEEELQQEQPEEVDFKAEEETKKQQLEDKPPKVLLSQEVNCKDASFTPLVEKRPIPQTPHASKPHQSRHSTLTDYSEPTSQSSSSTLDDDDDSCTPVFVRSINNSRASIVTDFNEPPDTQNVTIRGGTPVSGMQEILPHEFSMTTSLVTPKEDDDGLTEEVQGAHYVVEQSSFIQPTNSEQDHQDESEDDNGIEEDGGIGSHYLDQDSSFIQLTLSTQELQDESQSPNENITPVDQVLTSTEDEQRRTSRKSLSTRKQTPGKELKKRITSGSADKVRSLNLDEEFDGDDNSDSDGYIEAELLEKQLDAIEAVTVKSKSPQLRRKSSLKSMDSRRRSRTSSVSFKEDNRGKIVPQVFNFNKDQGSEDQGSETDSPPSSDDEEMETIDIKTEVKEGNSARRPIGQRIFHTGEVAKAKEVDQEENVLRHKLFQTPVKLGKEIATELEAEIVEATPVLQATRQENRVAQETIVHNGTTNATIEATQPAPRRTGDNSYSQSQTSTPQPIAHQTHRVAPFTSFLWNVPPPQPINRIAPQNFDSPARQAEDVDGLVSVSNTPVTHQPRPDTRTHKVPRR